MDKYSIRFHKPKIIFSDADYKKFGEIAESGWVVTGKYTEVFENEFRTFAGVKHAIACSSATQGLLISLKAAGIKNKKIAIPAFTWGSTLYAVEASGNTPVFCDVDKDKWLMSTEGDYDVVMGVDTFGNEFDFKTDKPLFVDAAHGIGLRTLGRRGMAEVVSFSFTKPVTSMQGGMILTNDEKIYREAKELRDLTAKMCEINAIVGLNSLQKYNELKKAARFPADIAMLEYRKYLKIPYREQQTINCNVYAILLENKEARDRVSRVFEERGIEPKIYYEPLVKGFPNTDWIYERILALPTYDEAIPHIPKICKIINESYL